MQFAVLGRIENYLDAWDMGGIENTSTVERSVGIVLQHPRLRISLRIVNSAWCR